ncbi:hypothetical protein OG897_08510 [Streptomyces sp. NBC_00237]|uniref:hypothetical protein n=1 Tax=Streptomyces sp. NBC_00237 TaxID=2975687 RepID=UPI0022561BCA|nr:hypothetical protein [Streptomyces sp. NBC_00237]MCX5201493.1 hypothetical protein [Streptomyces sp. NBC_00237]
MTDYTPTTAAEITEEIVDAAYEIADGWFQGKRINWERLLYRLDGMELADGRRLYMPEDLTHPANEALKKAVNKMR